MTSVLLRRALTDRGYAGLRSLPERVEVLLGNLEAPPRLGAHLRAVHEVAWRLVDWVGRSHPEMEFDQETMLFGAATHDIGKVVHPDELSGPGTAHEQAGYELLLARGFDMTLDDELGRIAADADRRLAFQASYPVSA